MDHGSTEIPDEQKEPAPGLPFAPLAILALGVFLALLFAVLVAVRADWTDNDTLSATQGLPDLHQDLAAHEWLLDRADSSLEIDDANPVTLVFGEDGVSGMGPCNAYRGQLSVDDDSDTVEIADIARTAKACEEPTMRAEDEYLTVLPRVRDVELTGGHDRNRLVLGNGRGDRLAFTAVDMYEQLLGTWHVVNVARDESVRSVVEGTTPILVFHDNHDVTLDTGCNTVRGTFELEQNRLSVEQAAQTLMTCDTPVGVMEQEQALVGVLSNAARIQVVPGTLTIFDDDGDILLIATDEASG